MSNDKEQKIIDGAHTVHIDLTEAAGGGKIVVMREEDGTVSLARQPPNRTYQNFVLRDLPAPIAFMIGRMMMHIALQVDPSLKGTL